MALNDLPDIGEDLGVFLGDVEFLRRVVFEVEEQRRVVFFWFFSVTSLSDKMCLPGAFSDGHNFSAAIEEHYISGTWAGAKQGREDINAVNNPVFGDGDASEFEGGGEDIHSAGEACIGGIWFYFSGPPCDTGLAHTAFPSAALSPAEESCRASVKVHNQPGAVVAGEENKRVFVEVVFAESVEDFSDAPVEFFDDIAIKAAETCVLKMP